MAITREYIPIIQSMHLLQQQLNTALENIYGAIDNPVTPALTFDTLPDAPVAGQRAFITDCNTTTFLDEAAGSGANAVPVVYDGAKWVVG